MKPFRLFVFIIALLGWACLSQTLAQQNTEKTALRGWLSDEGCGSGRARDGIYTGTNPECAKKCVREGKKIVFLDPDHKRLLTIANQDAAKENIGDFVEIAGSLDEKTMTLRIESLKLLEKGRAMCGIPPKKKS